MIFELTTDEIEQPVGGSASNSTWTEEHSWETAGIAVGATLSIAALIGLNIYVCYKWIIYNRRIGNLPYDNPLREFNRMQHEERNNLKIDWALESR